jgi:hypothetical protein
MAGVVAAALQLSSRAVVRVQDGNILPEVSEGASPVVDDSDAVRAIDSDLRLLAAIDSDLVNLIDSNWAAMIYLDRVVAVNSDMGVAADAEGGAVMSLAAMAAVDSEVPVGEVPVGAFIDSHREATIDSAVMVVSDVVMKGD